MSGFPVLEMLVTTSVRCWFRAAEEPNRLLFWIPTMVAWVVSWLPRKSVTARVTVCPRASFSFCKFSDSKYLLGRIIWFSCDRLSSCVPDARLASVREPMSLTVSLYFSLFVVCM